MEDLCWTTHAVWVNEDHNKFYTITVSLEADGSATEVRRWGRRPDTGFNGQSFVLAHMNITAAIASAQTKMNEKISKGYCSLSAHAVIH